MHQIERRRLATDEIRVEGESPIITGYAALFNSLSEDLGGFREILAPGCFANALAKDTLHVRCLVNHDDNLILGSSRSGTLKVREDSKGLFFEVLPDLNVTYARDYTAVVKRGDIQHCSFGFTMFGDYQRGEAWSETPEGFTLRTITEINELFDVSIVVYPAYLSTIVNVRSLNQYRESLQAPRQNMLDLKLRRLNFYKTLYL